MQKTAKILLALLLGSALWAEAAPVKRKKLTPAQEKAAQFRAYERYEGINTSRRTKLRAWFAKKASGKSPWLGGGVRQIAHTFQQTQPVPSNSDKYKVGY